LSAIGSSPSLSSFDVSYNEDLSIIFPAEFNVLGMSIKRNVDYTKNEFFRKWRLFTAEPQLINNFRALVEEHSM
jgi:hypothetical protein